jgi:carboxypeptidase C (cathepsin A)
VFNERYINYTLSLYDDAFTRSVLPILLDVCCGDNQVLNVDDFVHVNTSIRHLKWMLTLNCQSMYDETMSCENCKNIVGTRRIDILNFLWKNQSADYEIIDSTLYNTAARLGYIDIIEWGIANKL